MLQAYAFPCILRPLRKLRACFFCHRQRKPAIPLAAAGPLSSCDGGGTPPSPFREAEASRRAGSVRRSRLVRDDSWLASRSRRIFPCPKRRLTSFLVGEAISLPPVLNIPRGWLIAAPMSSSEGKASLIPPSSPPEKLFSLSRKKGLTKTRSFVIIIKRRGGIAQLGAHTVFNQPPV